jgi:hypothetical protein
MANPDLQRESGEPQEPATRGRPMEIVYLPSAFDMGEFPSEEPAQASPEPASAPATPVPASTEAAASTEVAAPPPAAEAPSPEPHPPLDFSSRAPAPLVTPLRSAGDDSGEHVTLLEVLESGEHVTWQEAVAIVQQLCAELKDVPSHAPVLVEPGAIQITAGGQLHLMTSQQGGDPLVIQLGRLLRAMLSTETVPAELRLLVSQATFELAIFESVEQFAAALDKLLGPPDPAEVKAAFRRVLHQPHERPLVLSPPPPAEPFVPSRPIPPLLPEPAQPRQRPRRSLRRFDASGLIARVAVSAAVLAAIVIGGITLTKEPLVAPSHGASMPPPPPEAAVPPPQLALSPAATPTAPPTRSINGPVEAEPSPRPPARTERIGRSGPRAIIVPAPAPDLAETTGTLPRPVPKLSANDSPADMVRRASALFGEGKASDATILLDLLVMTAPLYEPAAGALPAEGTSALHASQRLLLPNIASRELDKATAALQSGDADRAVTLGGGVSAMLDRFDPDSVSPLRQRLDQLLRKANAARSAAENTVYGGKDLDVIPPQPLSRQFPLGPPQGVPPQRVGTLELIVGKAGDVEFVKLHTPLNRYHERMIVSAVKAWRYSPALRAGKPVRFRLTISINLPESGAGES